MLNNSNQIESKRKLRVFLGRAIWI